MSATPESGPEATAYAQRDALPWRLAFIAYAIALTVATHWPRLQFGPEVPATDKMAHLLAFGLATFLLRHTRWIRGLLALAVVVIAWSTLDEMGQGVPVLNRSVSWHDVLANTLGILVMVAWLWALAPLGSAVNRRRLDLDAFAFDRVFRSWGTWLVFTLVFLACALPVAIVWSVFEPTTVRRTILVAAGVCTITGVLISVHMWRREKRLAIETRACFACGTAARDLAFDDSGRGRCPACAGPLELAQWGNPAAPTPRTSLGLAAAPAVVAAAVVVAVFGAVLLTPHLYEIALGSATGSSRAPRVARFFGTIPTTLYRTVDLALFLLILAPAVRSYRRRLARYHDRAVRCRRCGHDLRATPAHDGAGVCGECGKGFTVECDEQAP